MHRWEYPTSADADRLLETLYRGECDAQESEYLHVMLAWFFLSKTRYDSAERHLAALPNDLSTTETSAAARAVRAFHASLHGKLSDARELIESISPADLPAGLHARIEIVVGKIAAQSKGDEQSRLHYERALNLAESHDLPGIAGVACFFLGVHWKDQMEYALSEHFTQRSISAFERGGLSDYAERARYRLFTLYRRRGDLSQALEQHEALAPSRRNDVRFLADSARLFIMLRQPERAAQVFASMPAVTGQRIESRVQAIILALRSDLFAQNGDHEEALRIVEIALDRARAIADPSPLVGEILIRRAYLFHALERYEDAEFQIEDAHRVCTETNEFFGFGLIQRLQGLLAKQKMKYKLAEMLLEQSARFFESRGELFECANSYSTLSEFYNRRQEKKALESGVQALALYLKIGAEVQSAEMREKLHNMAMLSSQPSPSIARLKDHERDLIESVLEECSGNISHAAQVLGISRSKIYRRLKKR